MPSHGETHPVGDQKSYVYGHMRALFDTHVYGNTMLPSRPEQIQYVRGRIQGFEDAGITLDEDTVGLVTAIAQIDAHREYRERRDGIALEEKDD